MALIDKIQDSNLGLKGISSARVSNPKHVFDPNNDPQRLALSDTLVPLDNSEYGLKGKTPEKIKGTEKSSDTHAFDPKPGVGGNEQYKVKSTLDLKGKTPTSVSNPVHVFDPNNDPENLALSDTLVPLDNSKYGLKGKTPSTLPSALRSSATHVYDPDFYTGQATDPLLNLTGQALKTAQTNRRGNNTVTFQSVYAAPVDQTTRKYQDRVTGGGGASGFDSDFETGGVIDRV